MPNYTYSNAIGNIETAVSNSFSIYILKLHWSTYNALSYVKYTKKQISHMAFTNIIY